MKTKEFYAHIRTQNPQFNSVFLDRFYRYLRSCYYHTGAPCNYRLFEDFIVDFSFIEVEMNSVVDDPAWLQPIHTMFRGKFVHCGVLFLYEIILYQKYSYCSLETLPDNPYFYNFRDVLVLLCKHHFTWLDFNINDFLGVCNVLLPLEKQPELIYSLRTVYEIFKKGGNNFHEFLDNSASQYTDIYKGNVYLAH